MNDLIEIPFKKHTAAVNMAVDALMLEYAGTVGTPFWRFYGWSEPALTFGYSQKWEWIEKQLPGFPGVTIRRTTGGGLVDHRDDLTYALSIPAGHPFHRRQAAELYRELHQALAGILASLGFPAALYPCNRGCGQSPSPITGICFQAPEPHDVVHPASGLKIAGAAMKRTRSGLLVQGSLSRQALPGLGDESLQSAWREKLAEWLQLGPARPPDPFPAPRIESLANRFAQPAWNQRR